MQTPTRLVHPGLEQQPVAECGAVHGFTTARGLSSGVCRLGPLPFRQGRHAGPSSSGRSRRCRRGGGRAEGRDLAVGLGGGADCDDFDCSVARACRTLLVLVELGAEDAAEDSADDDEGQQASSNPVLLVAPAAVSSLSVHFAACESTCAESSCTCTLLAVQIGRRVVVVVCLRVLVERGV